MSLTNCIPKTDWFGLVTGLTLFAVGVIHTMTVIGSIIGIRLLLASLALFEDHPTLAEAVLTG